MFNYQTTDKQYFVPNKPFNETDLRDLLEPDVDLFLLQTLPHAFEASSPKTIDSLSDNASSSPISQYVDDFKESELVVHVSMNRSWNMAIVMLILQHILLGIYK